MTTNKVRPIWLEKVRLLRKRFWSKTYSQFGEDVFLQTLLAGKSSGVYVDVGGFHPRKYSNTRLLYEQGWSGINIDMFEKKIELFKFDRPHDINVCCAVSDRNGEITAYEFPGIGALDTTDERVARGWAAQFKREYVKRLVPTRTLNDILLENKIEQIDFLNVDVEGAEISVLKGFDIARYKPKCIAIEIHGEVSNVQDSEVCQILQSGGMKLAGCLPPTYFFTRLTA